MCDAQTIRPPCIRHPEPRVRQWPSIAPTRRSREPIDLESPRDGTPAIRTGVGQCSTPILTVQSTIDNWWVAEEPRRSRRLAECRLASVDDGLPSFGEE